MSDLNPRGVPITLADGVERRFLFTLRVFDVIQDAYGVPVFDVVMRLADKTKNVKTMAELATILANDEVDREEFFKGKTDISRITEKEAYWLIDADNMGEVSTAILEAFGFATPKPDEDDNDPNQKTVQQK